VNMYLRMSIVAYRRDFCVNKIGVYNIKRLSR
jgi:hypothetical protein